MRRDRTRVLRFGAVGILNTLLDFAVFFTLSALGSPIVLANLLSTSLALGVSYLLNRRFTFRTHSRPRRQLMLFLIVTMLGLWVVQPLVILATVSLCSYLGVNEALALVLGKVIATMATLVWNYVLYARLVFRA